MCNLRGDLLPVFDLAAVLGLPRSAAPQRLLVAERGGTRAGFAVDEVTDVDELPEADQEADGDLLSGAALVDGALVGVIDVDRLFDTLGEGGSMSQPEAEFLGIFRDEANERLDSMSTALLAIEGGSTSADAIDSLFRDAHTIKGGAGMLGLDEIAELAHAVEDVLADARALGKLPAGLADPLLRAGDALRALVNGDAPADPQTIPNLIAELAAGPALDGEEAAAPAARKRAPKSPPLRVVKERRVAPEAEATPPAVERRSAPSEARGRTVRVPAEKLDVLLDLVGETVLHRQRLGHLVASGDSAQHEELSDELDLGDRLLGALQDAAIQTRTLPFGSITGPFPRAIRDIANAEGKEVELVVRGTETELDRVILEGLSEPLVHMLRNAVAHGIELPAERLDGRQGRARARRAGSGAARRARRGDRRGRRARGFSRAPRAGRPGGLARGHPCAPGLLDASPR